VLGVIASSRYLSSAISNDASLGRKPVGSADGFVRPGGRARRKPGGSGPEQGAKSCTISKHANITFDAPKIRCFHCLLCIRTRPSEAMCPTWP
jgi:hypothetical protein